MCDTTRQALRAPANDLVFVDDVQIRDRVETVKLWSIAGAATISQPEALKASGPAV
jgi:hypothetical protein